ncbi:hypothetical protein BGZ47_005449 [Haplosporangium gracile]|nr:hypothetical protein BGZ47_005449 [Haplosporangium gracile]
MSGVVNYIVNYRHFYRILPEHIVEDVWLEEETGEKLPTVISVPPFLLKDVQELIDDKVEEFIFIVQATLDRYGCTWETLNNLAVAMIAIDYLQQLKIFPNLLQPQGKRVNFDFYSGPIEERLPLEESVARDNDDIAEALWDLISTKGRKKRGKTSSSSTASSGQRKHVHGAACDLNVKGFLEGLLGCCRLVNYSFDKKLEAKFQPEKNLDKSLSDDLDDEQFERSLVKCRSHMASPSSSSNKRFSGLVVQGPFLSDRNLTTLTTGWRFRSISTVFQRVSAALSSKRGIFMNGLMRMTLPENDPREEAKQIESVHAQLKAIIGLRDEYGDFASGPSMDELAKGFLLHCAKGVRRIRK